MIRQATYLVAMSIVFYVCAVFGSAVAKQSRFHIDFDGKQTYIFSIYNKNIIHCETRESEQWRFFFRLTTEDIGSLNGLASISLT